MAEENTTHPNAYRIEAQEKRGAAARLANEANELEAKAKELESPVVEEQPVAEAPKEKEEPQKDKKLFSK